MTLPNLFKFPHEIDSFFIPKDINYIYSLTYDDGTNVFKKGLLNLPLNDINYLLNLNISKNYELLRENLVINLLSNRICENCGNKDNIKKLLICVKCSLAWYCSISCQTEHYSTHILRCNNINGPLNEGYQKILVLPVKTN